MCILQCWESSGVKTRLALMSGLLEPIVLKPYRNGWGGETPYKFLLVYVFTRMQSLFD